MPLSEIPVGTLIHAIEFQPGKGAAIARSAGTACQLMGKEGKYAIIRMPSSEMRRVLVTCRSLHRRGWQLRARQHRDR